MHHMDQLPAAPIFRSLLAVSVCCHKCHTKVPNLDGPNATLLAWQQQHFLMWQYHPWEDAVE